MTLHTTDQVAFVELWAGIKSYVPAKDQQSCADQYIANLDEAGLIDFNSGCDDLYGVCDTFDKALRQFIHEQGYTADEADVDADDWDE